MARVVAASDFLDRGEGGPQKVCAAHVLDVLEDRGETIEAEAGVDALIGAQKTSYGRIKKLSTTLAQ
ncbi:hypothetical protein [Streptomyces sp. YPW6]|uniref:hypothetical protein n=1 Tax=Streptomyces sp. YPW6 TaxID=2840373 RepID=UPI003D756F5B